MIPTDEQLAITNADTFWSRYGYSRHDQNIFMDELDNKLYQEESNFQLHFLYRLQSLSSKDYEEHLKKCIYKNDPLKCPDNLYYINVHRVLERKIKEINPNYDRQNLNTELASKTLLAFKDFPDAAKIYQSALKDFQEGSNDRNVVDSMRLSFEVFLKQKLGNNDPLEKQADALGKLLSQTGTSEAIMGMYIKLLKGYTDYQNENVKHNDKLKRDEVELLMNLTLSFINFIVGK